MCSLPYNYHVITMVSAVKSSICTLWKISYSLFIQELGEGNIEEMYTCSLASQNFMELKSKEYLTAWGKAGSSQG